jgi:DNA-directed RNA polymerase specialized sigma24 family protein
MQTFVDRLRRVEPLLWSYATHYSIPGVLPPEDLYQEGLIELDRYATEWPDLDDAAFLQKLRRRLSSVMIDHVRHHNRTCRDWKQTLIEDTESLLDAETSLEKFAYLPHDVLQSLEDFHPSPEDEYERKRREREAECFIEDVRSGLDKEAQWVFQEILHGEVPEQIKGEFERVPTHLSEQVIGLIFGWDRSYSRRVLQRVRKRARLVIQRYRLSGQTLLWSQA